MIDSWHLAYNRVQTFSPVPLQTKFSSFTLLFAILVLHSTAAIAQDLIVSRVIDGDTIELSDGQKIRLIGIDAPESHYSYKLTRDSERSARDAETIRSYGILAGEYLSGIALNRRVHLVYDAANNVTNHKDRFGRTLAYVNVLDEDGNAVYSLNDRMIFDGYANTYTKYPFARMDWYRTAERIARTESRGFWNPLFDLDAEINRSDETVLYVTRTGTKYHRYNCPALRYSKIPLSEARHKTYTACRICKPPAL